MLVFIFRQLSKLPLPLLHGLGALLGWIVYAASPAYRNRLKGNIARAGYGDWLHAAVAHAGKSLLELPFIWFAPPARVIRTVSNEDWHVAQEAIDAGRGVIFLTPHLGCFEVSAQVAATFVPLTVLYRPPRKNFLKPLLEGARARTNLALAPANLSGVRTLLKTLRKGGAIGLLPDQVPQQGEGVWADFFGKPAYTMTLSAKLQQMTGAPIILAYAERLARGRGYALRLTRFEPPPDATPQRQARAINAAMEALIAHCPEQYFWSYNRYKIPAGAARPEEAVTGDAA